MIEIVDDVRDDERPADDESAATAATRARGTGADTACYVYCLVRSPAPPALEAAPDGLPDVGPLRFLPVEGDLRLVVADAPLPRYGAAEIESRLDDLAWVSRRAVAHERVVEHFLGAGAVVPLKLFTLFTSDRRAIAGIMDDREALERTLEKVTGRSEWGVQVRLLHRAAHGDEAESPRSGTEYLTRKRRSRRSADAIPTTVQGAVEGVVAALAVEAEASRRHSLPAPSGATPLLLDAAFLVDDEAIDGFESAVEHAARQLGDHGCEIAVTGPWPAYNFLESGSLAESDRAAARTSHEDPSRGDRRTSVEDAAGDEGDPGRDAQGSRDHASG